MARERNWVFIQIGLVLVLRYYYLLLLLLYVVCQILPHNSEAHVRTVRTRDMTPSNVTLVTDTIRVCDQDSSIMACMCVRVCVCVCV